MKILMTFIFLGLSVIAFGMTETFLKMKPDRSYMNFALEHYLEFHRKYFPSTIVYNEFAETLINRIDHWLVPGHPELDQFLIGHQTNKEGKLLLSHRIFIHPELRNHTFILRAHLSKNFEPWFYQVHDSGTTCFIGRIKEEKKLTLHHQCRQKHEQAFSKGVREVISREITLSWPNPFPALINWEIRTMDGEKLKSIYYFSPSTHPSRIPKELYPVINAHGIQALFPFNKYSIDDEGKMTVFYP